MLNNAHHNKMSGGMRSLLFWYLVVSISISWSEANLGVAVNDPCFSNPCWNAGTCVSNGSVFTCSCPQGFSGEKCEFHVTHCAVNPCVNGICRLSKDGLPECFCTPGFTGERCHINEDECASHPCKNGALCVDEVNGYKCVCKGDTYGRHCEIHQRDIMQCVARCDEEPCWRNNSAIIPVKWGYGVSICSTSHSCFGGENDTEADLFDTFVEVQLKPLQIQLGDTLNFTADEEIVAYVDGFVPHHVVAANGSSAFRACNESNGIPLVNKPTNSVVVGLDILTLGTKYFIANIDSTFRCNFGLRLNVSVKESHCKAPSESEICSGRGQCSTNFSLPDFRCKCCGGFRGEFCEKVDYCFSKPCKNSAVCQNRESSADGSTHLCICEPGYEGRDCSEIKDLCLSSPCLNGGSCVPEVNNFTCHCARGFSGRNCQVDINECASNPCVNGGTCVDGAGSFSCHCPAGFTGKSINLSFCGNTDSSNKVAILNK